ncbi:uncharacterized protein HD556DRAFT_1523297 [Suillus plorans]|uniref:Uncharacterized protein n=1 Tax=Suillus plorans TaxID=116603 RepID=A0A9P7DWL1_9AGAM|nr:uncharacterized protein HD556DRAFT_1523297 [Suillus plorans]KAG1804753.1 hypothetical protein HD556DRAFT_1523297 [Suillus plorans]
MRIPRAPTPVVLGAKCSPALFSRSPSSALIHDRHLMASSGRKKTRSTNRGWRWAEFVEHPGYESPASMSQQKAKVICTRQLENYVAAEQVHDEREVQFGSRGHVRDENAIKGAVWATGMHDPQRIWLVSRPKTLLMHIRDCNLHIESIQAHARSDLLAYRSPNKSARFNQPVMMHAALSAPQSCDDSSQIVGPTAAHSIYFPSSASASASASVSPALGLVVPDLLMPSAGCSSGLLSLPSPLAFDSRALSPAMSDITISPEFQPLDIYTHLTRGLPR